VLLVMDVQQGIVGRFGDPAGYLDRLAQAIGAARAAGMHVAYVRVGFRPGHPEISARNKTFAAIASSSAFTDEDPAAGIHPAIAPDPHDLVITKRRVSAFAGSDLEVLLRGLPPARLSWPASPPAAWCFPPCARLQTWTTASSSSPTGAWTRTARCTES
jgi:nicotinamidase-related amidase